MVKHLPTMWETWVQSLGWEDLLEKEMATHSNILAWRIPWTEEPGGLQSMGSQESDTTQQLNHYHHSRDNGGREKVKEEHSEDPFKNAWQNLS